MFEQGHWVKPMEELGSGGTMPKPKRTITSSHVWEVAQVRKAIDENKPANEKYYGGPQTQAQFEETKEYTDGF